jgi:hypothetical protein
VKNTLRGFIDIELGIGLQIKGATLHVTEGRAWIGVPSRSMMGSDGQTIINQANGKPAYPAILGWRSKVLADAFGKAVVRLLVEQHPDALDGSDR